MVAVFAGFAASAIRSCPAVGLRPGIAVLVDATIIRSVLLPAAWVLGNWNWYLPRPRVAAEDRDRQTAGPEPGPRPTRA